MAERFVKALIYGEGGAGKTRWVADAPKPWWFDWESSTETLLHWSEFEHIAKERTTNYPDPKKMAEIIRSAVRNPEIETLVLDSMTSALFAFMEDYMEAKVEANKGKGDEFKRADTDYGYATNVFTKLLSLLQRAKINVVLIAHERYEYTGERDTRTISKVFPDFTPRIGQAAARLVNFVGYLESRPGSESRKTERKLYVNPTHMIAAKNRLNIQETFLLNPTWKDVFER